MRSSALCLSCAVLLLSVLLLSACGSGRELESVTISPASANAQNVQFSATGVFSKPPSPQPLNGGEVTWCVGSSNGRCVGNVNPGATVNQNGTAQCAPTFSGTVTILAGKANPVMNPDTGAQMSVFGAAQLTCP